MCLAVPMKLVSVEGSEGRADVGGVRRTVMLDLVPEAQVGDFVIVHAGYAIQTMDEESAAETIALLLPPSDGTHELGLADWVEQHPLPLRGAPAEGLPDTLVEAVKETEALNASIASALKDEPIIYILGSGPNHATAYCLAMCYLQEMQWKHGVSFDAAEFLHGAMEVVTDETPVILFLGEEATRPIDERAKAFLEKRKPNYSGR